MNASRRTGSCASFAVYRSTAISLTYSSTRKAATVGATSSHRKKVFSQMANCFNWFRPRLATVHGPSRHDDRVRQNVHSVRHPRKLGWQRLAGFLRESALASGQLLKTEPPRYSTVDGSIVPTQGPAVAERHRSRGSCASAWAPSSMFQAKNISSTQSDTAPNRYPSLVGRSMVVQSVTLITRCLTLSIERTSSSRLAPRVMQPTRWPSVMTS